jgi:hypothetical protein
VEVGHRPARADHDANDPNCDIDRHFMLQQRMRISPYQSTRLTRYDVRP